MFFHPCISNACLCILLHLSLSFVNKCRTEQQSIWVGARGWPLHSNTTVHSDPLIRLFCDLSLSLSTNCFLNKVTLNNYLEKLKMSFRASRVVVLNLLCFMDSWKWIKFPRTPKLSKCSIGGPLNTCKRALKGIILYFCDLRGPLRSVFLNVW